MTRFFNIIILTLITFSFVSCSDDGGTNNTGPVEPQENENFAFIIYDGLNEQLANDMETALDNNFSRITSDLGIDNMPRVTIRLWGDYSHFLDDMESIIGTRYNGATGYVTGNNEVCMFSTNDNPMTAVHEFAHLVSMQVNPSIPNNPRWLWEAIALYEAQDFVNPSNLSYMVSGDYPTLQELNTDFNSSNHSIYSVGYTLLEYVIETWSRETMLNLIRSNGNTSTTLGVTTRQFEEGWYNFVYNKYISISKSAI